MPVTRRLCGHGVGCASTEKRGCMGRRIVMICEWYPPVMGGLELASQRIARTLADLGPAVEVLTTATTPGPVGWETVTEDDGIVVTRVRPQQEGEQAAVMSRALEARGPADAVIVMYLYHYALPAVLAAARWGVPSVLCGRGRDALFELFDWQTAPMLIPALARATLATGVTREIVRLLQPFRPGLPTDYWPNPVDGDVFAPQPADARVAMRHGIPLDGLRIGLVGNTRPSKGIGEALSAFALVAARRPDARLIIVGGLREPATGIVAAWRQAEPFAAARLVVVPFLPQAELPAVFACLDQVWSPAIFDGFSNALLQAASCEMPLIVTPVGGNADVVVHGQTGLVVPVGDARALAEAALTLAENPEQATAMGRAARQLTRRDHDPAIERQRLQGLLQSLGLA